MLLLKEYHIHMMCIVFQNVESSHAVVGVTEEMTKSLEVLEKVLPRYFTGALDIYHDSRKNVTVNINQFKPRHDKQFVRQTLEKMLVRELDFYHYCKQRLHRQHLAFVEKSPISTWLL